MQTDPDEIITARRVRWGIFSAANISVTRVAPAINASSNGKLVAVASRNPSRAQEAYSFVPGVRVYSDYESLINDPQVDAIYNPLPNSLHAEWSIRALEAGKNVLCEKPLAVTAEEGAQMVEAAQASGKLLMEAFMYRFHPQIVWSLKQIADGRIGKVKLVHSSFSFNILVPPRPKDIRLQASLAGGSLMDVGCYPINFCRAVYGHSPIAAAARVHTPEGFDVELSANAVLDYGDGCFALIDSSFELPGRQVAQVIGEEGKISIPVPFTPGIHEATVILSMEGQTIHQHFAPIDQYRLEVEHFDSCIQFGHQPALSLDVSLENLATIEAIYRSAGYAWPR
jgi:D-xylose 1-dehydrogenase (NADP+, D-xylono-1,5-lactone-forming)